MEVIVAHHRPDTGTLPTRTNRLYYLCPPCGTPTEHTHSSTHEEGTGVLTLWQCTTCLIYDMKWENWRQFGR